jgi:hypothetical protein
MKTYWGVDVGLWINLLLFLTSTLDKGEWSPLRNGRFTPEDRAPDKQWVGGWLPELVWTLWRKYSLSPRRILDYSSISIWIYRGRFTWVSRMCSCRHVSESPAESKCLWKLVQRHVLLWTSILIGVAKQMYITQPADRWKSHASPSNNHSKYLTRLETLGFLSADSGVTFNYL